MRTILLFAPAMLCAGSMLVCVRMMARGHHDERPPVPRDEEHIT